MKLSEFIHQHMNDIVADWERFAATIPGTGQLSKHELEDHARQMLETIAEQIENPRSYPPGEGSTPLEHLNAGPSHEAGQAHASGRLSHGFTLFQIMAEFRALRASVIRLWQKHKPQLEDKDIDQITSFNDGIDRVLMDSVSAYSEELDKSRQLFLGILGHDLRSPLNAMMMCATLIRQDTRAGSRQSRCANTILRSGEKIELILGDLLDVARTRLGGHMPLDTHGLDLHQLSEEIVAELQAAHPGTDIRLTCDGDVSGCWDEMRINQLLWNLIGNAIKHGAPDKPVRVNIHNEGAKVRIEVHNYGDPIPDSAHSSIFDPLTALKHQQQTRVTASGIGLGLYISRAIVEAHGGEIQLSSSSETGTRFCVWLPKSHPEPRCEDGN